jgi:hypothetical protein
LGLAVFGIIMYYLRFIIQGMIDFSVKSKNNFRDGYPWLKYFDGVYLCLSFPEGKLLQHACDPVYATI